MPHVISVSRRTDIPAFYTEWFMNRIREGFARYRNPFGGKMCEVSLKPDDVIAFVFWSRNYAPLLPHLPELEKRGYGGYFHFTLTDYGQPLERNAPPAEKMLDVFKRLAELTSPQHVLWRFDPIILSNTITDEMIVEKFDFLARQLSGFTECCYISFVDLYRKVQKNVATLAEQGVQMYDPEDEIKKDIAARLAAIGEQYGIRLYACCEALLLDVPGIHQAHCVDPLLLHDLFPEKFQTLKPAPTREGCGCFASRDIGAYDTCIHGCRYCYANSSHEKALKRFDGIQKNMPAAVLDAQ